MIYSLSRDGHFWPLIREQGVWDSGGLRHISENRGSVMAQAITSWLISDGRFRVHAINAVGRRSARIIEIEDVDTGERFHGSARKLQSMFQSLGSSGVEVPSRPALLSCNPVL
jgi:hypothetical protein